MGCNASKGNYETAAIKGELLVSELLGKIEDNDYFAKAMTVLENFVIEPPNADECKSENYLDVQHAYKLCDDGYLPLENGYARGADGTWCIACKIDLENVTGEMFEWWFRACENTER